MSKIVLFQDGWFRSIFQSSYPRAVIGLPEQTNFEKREFHETTFWRTVPEGLN